MVSLTALWLPILLSAVLVFVASSIIHMALRWHSSDFKRFPNENGVMDALRPFDLPPADYVAPLPESRAHMRSPEFKSKQARGPSFTLTILANTSIGRNLVKWFLYSIIIGVFAAYALALWQNWIWYARSLGYTVRTTIDGLIYALLTGGAFGWLWP